MAVVVKVLQSRHEGTLEKIPESTILVAMVYRWNSTHAW